MHEVFVFDMECKGHVQRWKEDTVRIEALNEARVLRGFYEEDIEKSYYDPFEFDNLIPEFLELIEKVLSGAELEKLIKKWLVNWGPLYMGYDRRNTVENFWEESLKFYRLWSFYRVVSSRDEVAIRSSIKIEEDRGTKIISFFPGEDSFSSIRIPEDISQRFSIPEFEFDLQVKFPFQINKNRDVFEQIQEYSTLFLLAQIETYTNNANLTWDSMTHEKQKGKSVFKIKPALHTGSNLIDALYLQFYILLSENEKKICPVCNNPFLPSRKDKKYCSDTCKLTARTRRYRARKG